MNNLTKRILTAIIAGTATVYSILNWETGLWVFTFLIALFSYAEWLHLFEVKLLKPATLPPYIFICSVWSGLFPGVNDQIREIFLLIGFGFLPFTLIPFLRKAPGAEQIKTLLVLFGGILYLIPPLYFFHETAYINDFEYTPYFPLGLLFIIWACDSTAYFVGKKFGRKKIAPLISPGKSWAGYWGGVVGALLTGLILSQYFGTPGIKWLIPAVIIGFLGPMGDLAESFIKRSSGIKDSGSLLPGHGGLLDRFDVSLFLMPFLYFIIKIFF